MTDRFNCRECKSPLVPLYYRDVKNNKTQRIKDRFYCFKCNSVEIIM